VPAMVESNGAVRLFAASLEFTRWVDAQLPGQSSRPASVSEEVEIELVDEAA
jgi:hypothetical protein